jgi:subtilisin family serine protease
MLMTHSVRRFTLVLLAAAVSTAGAWAAAPQTRVDWDNPVFTEEFVPGELIVGFKPVVQAAAREGVHQAIGAEVVRRFPAISADRVRVKGQAAQAAMRAAAKAYLANPSVAYVEPNYIVRATATTPNDPRYGELWGMVRIRAPEMWDLFRGSTTIVVGVLDSGIRATHEDLAGNMTTNAFEIPGNGIDDDGNGYVGTGRTARARSAASATTWSAWRASTGAWASWAFASSATTARATPPTRSTRSCTLRATPAGSGSS